MKWNRREGMFLAAGTAMGMILMSLVFAVGLPGIRMGGPETVSTQTQTETETQTEGETHSAASIEKTQRIPLEAPIRAEWESSAVYHGGDEVASGGKIYRAKWWTQGERPGAADVWEDTGISAAESGRTSDVHISAGALSGAAADTPGVPAKSGNVRVVAYYPSWRSDQSKLRYDIITHVVYAFAVPTPEGGLRPLEGAEQVPELIRNAHGAGAQVLLGVGGWSYQDVPLESTFLSAAETPERIEAFTDAIVQMCETYGFDGADMDWEHPRVDGSSARRYEEMMLTLAGKLHSRGMLLTSAVLSGATADGNIYYDAAAHSDSVLAAVDWIHVMAYDGGDGERHSGYEFAVNSAGYWRDQRGVPSEKIVLGVPFYARPGWASYGEILASVPTAADSDHVTYNGMEVWYNGPDTIRQKAAYAAENLGGIMIWEITHDTADRQKSLLTAIGEVIKNKK